MGNAQFIFTNQSFQLPQPERPPQFFCLLTPESRILNPVRPARTTYDLRPTTYRKLTTFVFNNIGAFNA